MVFVTFITPPGVTYKSPGDLIPEVYIGKSVPAAVLNLNSPEPEVPPKL